MSNTKQKTKVQFLYHEVNKDLYAFFPDDTDYPDETLRESYSQGGQYCQCSIVYAAESRNATPKEYKAIKQELEGIGYDLKVVRK